MRCLIRHITRHSKGGMIYQDKTVSTRSLAIGRAADQQVFLADSRAALQHAVITGFTEGRFLVQSRALSGIRVNGRLLQSATLKVGDRIRIGQTELRLFEAPEGFDLTLEVEAGAKAQAPMVAEKPLAADFRKLSSTPSMRRWSWFLFSLVLLLFLAVPAGTQYLYEYYSPVLEKVAETLQDPDSDEFFEFPPMPFLLRDDFWNSGEIAGAHHFFGDACNTCHQEPFERVRDSTCTNCHQKTYHHVDPEFFDLPKLQETRCAECHHEHNGKHALIERDDTLCSDCHVDLSKQGVTTELDDALDFGTHHPPFKPTLIGHRNGEDFTRRVSMEDEKNYRETSNLEFSHDVHIDRKGLATFKGVFRLWCEDCHIHKAGSPGMEPVDYETMCHECHELLFEPQDESREVPHGKLSEVMFTLYEYYSKRALEGGYDDGDTPDFVSREHFPDEELDELDRLRALEWAREKAEEVGEEVFEFSLCINCHRVDLVSTDPVRWDIEPVRIIRKWMPKANFTHEKHKTMDCLFCHAAPGSTTSADILLPDLGICRECHGGVRERNKLQTTCVDCHGFHVASEFSMRKRELP